MNTLRSYIYGALQADSTLQTLLGSSARVRHRNLPDEPTVTAALPGWVVYGFITQGPRSGTRGNATQEGDVILSIDIYARTDWLLWQIKERIHMVIGNKSRQSATQKKALNVTEEAFNDLGIDEFLKCPHGNVTYRIAGIFA